MSNEELNAAIRSQRAGKQPEGGAAAADIGKLQKEAEAAKAELAAYKNGALLREKGVPEEYRDFVRYKVDSRIKDGQSFAEAADAFLKENPRYSGRRVVPRVISGMQAREEQPGTSGDPIRDYLNRRRAEQKALQQYFTKGDR